MTYYSSSDIFAPRSVKINIKTLFRMPQKAAIDLIEICSCRYCGTKLNLLPLHVKCKQTSVKVTNRHLSKLNIWFWRIILFVPLAIIVSHLVSGFLFTNSTKLIANIYQLCFLFNKLGTVSFIYVFHENATEITYLLYSLFQCNPKYKCKITNKTHEALFFASILTCVIGVFLFYSVVSPTVVFALPCLYESPITKLFGWRCSSMFFRIVISLFELVSMSATCGVGIVVLPVFLVTLEEITNKLQNLR